MKRIYSVIIATLFLGACATTRQTPAPIINGTTQSSSQAPASMPVATPVATSPAASTTSDASSSTTIAKATDDEDGTVVSNSAGKPTPAPKAKPAPAATPNQPVDTTATVSAATLGGLNWLAPTSGKIVQPYNATTKGIDVLGKEGQPVVAAYGGTVAYSGNGLKGYGNLVIIKHDGNYLTAYSHNKVNLVKEGDKVKRGQKIAELGKTESDRPILHFELRKNGKPIDPTPIFQ